MKCIYNPNTDAVYVLRGGEMNRYRLFKVNPLGWKRYLNQDGDGWTERKFAGVFTQEDCDNWAGDFDDLQLEPIGEDEAMRLIGAPMLPGLDT